MRILVVEDDKDLNRQLVEMLEEAGYVVDAALDGEEGYFLGSTEPYDAVVLDVGLPTKDGITILEEWRQENHTMPVLMLTARDRWSDKVAGIDAGADDYVAKPFHVEEVLARIRALIRRSSGLASSQINCGPLVFDTRTSKAQINGRNLKLTSLELRLLAYLLHHQGKIISRKKQVGPQVPDRRAVHLGDPHLQHHLVHTGYGRQIHILEPCCIEDVVQLHCVLGATQ